MSKEFGELTGPLYYPIVHAARTDQYHTYPYFSVIVALDNEESLAQAKDYGLNVIFPGETRKVQGQERVMQDRAGGHPYVTFEQNNRLPEGSNEDGSIIWGERKFIPCIADDKFTRADDGELYKPGEPIKELIGNGSIGTVRFALVPVPADKLNFRKKFGHTQSGYLEKLKVAHLVPYKK